MGGWRAWVVGAALVGGACTAGRAGGPGTGGAGTQESSVAPGAQAPEVRRESQRYVDAALGFQVDRPEDGWTLNVTGDEGEQGVTVPVVLRHASGATVVLQVAPAVATPLQYAERLVLGLGQQAGVVPGDLEPLPLSESAVGFRFRIPGTMRGRVAVRDGGPGRVFMMLATWPEVVPEVVPAAVDAIFRSVQPVHST